MIKLPAILQGQHHQGPRQGRQEGASSSGKNMVSNLARSPVELVFNDKNINVSNLPDGVDGPNPGTYLQAPVLAAKKCLASVLPALFHVLSGKQDRDSKKSLSIIGLEPNLTLKSDCGQTRESRHQVNGRLVQFPAVRISTLMA